MPIEDDTKIKEILMNAKTVAVVGASKKLYRDSNRIAMFLKLKSYDVYYVNPNYNEIAGEKCYPNLTAIGKQIDIVDVFRNPDAIDEIVDEAIKLKTRIIWLQYGVVNRSAAKRAESAGIEVIMDHCIAVDYSRLVR